MISFTLKIIELLQKLARSRLLISLESWNLARKLVFKYLLPLHSSHKLYLQDKNKQNGIYLMKFDNLLWQLPFLYELMSLAHLQGEQGDSSWNEPCVHRLSNLWSASAPGEVRYRYRYRYDTVQSSRRPYSWIGKNKSIKGAWLTGKLEPARTRYRSGLWYDGMFAISFGL